jgi:DNA-directed RNA polymerase subunit omega
MVSWRRLTSNEVILLSRPPLETLLSRVPNKYLMVMIAARRARELRSGQLPLVDVDSQNPVTIALEEIAAGRVEPEPGTQRVAGS